jgi:hypothetical protein
MTLILSWRSHLDEQVSNQYRSGSFVKGRTTIGVGMAFNFGADFISLFNGQPYNRYMKTPDPLAIHMGKAYYWQSHTRILDYAGNI